MPSSHNVGFGSAAWSGAASAKEEQRYARSRARVARIVAAGSEDAADAVSILEILGIEPSEGKSALALEPLWDEAPATASTPPVTTSSRDHAAA